MHFTLCSLVCAVSVQGVIQVMDVPDADGGHSVQKVGMLALHPQVLGRGAGVVESAAFALWRPLIYGFLSLGSLPGFRLSTSLKRLSLSALLSPLSPFFSWRLPDSLVDSPLD